MDPSTLLTLTLVSCACTLLAVGLALWQNGNARAWERHADAAGAECARLRGLLARVPRAPAKTVCVPMFHAPRAES